MIWCHLNLQQSVIQRVVQGFGSDKRSECYEYSSQRSTLEILKCLYDVNECLIQYGFFLFNASRAGISFICST